MLQSSKPFLLLRNAGQNILSPVSHEKSQKRVLAKTKIENNNYKYIFINNSKSSDDNQIFFFFFFLSHDTDHKDSYKQNKQKITSIQRNYENSLLVADRV